MSTTRTPHGATIQLSQLFGLPVEIQEFSTLNEKFSCHESEEPTASEVPIARYICIGNGGHRAISTNNITSIQSVPRLTLAAALYSHMPFVLRPITDDLTVTQRTQYRLRVIETYGGVDYAAYYLRTFDAGDVTITNDHTAVQGDMFPVAPTTTSDGIISTIAEVPFVLSATEVTAIKDAQQIIHGAEGFATISEIGLVTGIDRNLTGTFNGVDATYTEAIATQLHSSSNAGRLLDFSEAVTTPTTLTVGTLDPLITAS